MRESLIKAKNLVSYLDEVLNKFYVRDKDNKGRTGIDI